MFNDVVSSWEYLNECTYFAKPIYSEGKTMFNSGFRETFDIFYIKVNPETGEVDNDVSKNTVTKVWLEANSFCLQYNNFYADINGISADTFEEALIKLANRTYEICGEDYYMDYFIFEDIPADELFEKIGKDFYRMTDKLEAYWKEEELLERIKSFEIKLDFWLDM